MAVFQFFRLSAKWTKTRGSAAQAGQQVSGSAAPPGSRVSGPWGVSGSAAPGGSAGQRPRGVSGSVSGSGGSAAQGGQRVSTSVGGASAHSEGSQLYLGTRGRPLKNLRLRGRPQIFAQTRRGNFGGILQPYTQGFHTFYGHTRACSQPFAVR